MKEGEVDEESTKKSPEVEVASSTTTTKTLLSQRPDDDEHEHESPVSLNNDHHHVLTPRMSSQQRITSSTMATTPPRYGWLGWTPHWIQFLVNRKAFLFVFCVTCVLQGTFHTYFVAVITTLEKLFSIPSKVTGMLMMGSEIGQVSSALLLPYFVGNGHRPRWMAIGSSLFSVATLLCASPHVLIPMSLKIKSNQESQYCDAPPDPFLLQLMNSTSSGFLCNNNGSDDATINNLLLDNHDDNPHYVLFPIIFFSLLTIGLGQTATYTLGIPFLDDNVASRDSPIYFSITIGVRILGPVLGFILGSFCTRLYIYPHVDPGFEPSDHRWLGAWWLGMLLISCSLFVTSILMYGFPATLNKRANNNKKLEELLGNELEEVVEAAVANHEDEEEVIRPIKYTTHDELASPTATTRTRKEEEPRLHSFPQTIKRLILNKILVMRMFSCVFHLLPISGLYTFLPKYLESQFRLAAFQANLLTGTAGILVMGIGIFSSGVFIRRREPSAKGIALWVCGAAGVYSAGMVALMFVGCSVGGPGASVLLQQQQESNSPVSAFSDFSIREDGNFRLPNCATEKCLSCLDTVYAPVCGSDNHVYFSPCHAGCSKDDMINKTEKSGGGGGVSTKPLYTNCSCVGVSDGDYGADGGGQAQPGLCPVSCDLFPVYLTIFMVIVLVHSTSEVGSMLLTLRCVEPRDKAMALGLIQSAIGIFGNVPCALIYGTVVDSACIVWGGTSSGGAKSKDCFDGDGGGENDDGLGDDVPVTAGRGHCWVYDSTSFRIYFHGITALLMFFAFIIDGFVVFHANAINMATGAEEEEEQQQQEDHRSNGGGATSNTVTKGTEHDLPSYNHAAAVTSATRYHHEDEHNRDDDDDAGSPLLQHQLNGAISIVSGLSTNKSHPPPPPPSSSS